MIIIMSLQNIVLAMVLVIRLSTTLTYKLMLAMQPELLV